MRRLLALLAPLAGIYVLVVHGAVTLDLGIGRRTRALGPLTRTIAAPPETVFDVIAAPYLGRTPRAMQDKLQVWERSSDMALALLRGPVPHVAETYDLRELSEGTPFVYSGELGTDSWALGAWWGNRVAAPWERAVAASLDAIQAESERRTSRA